MCHRLLALCVEGFEVDLGQVHRREAGAADHVGDVGAQVRVHDVRAADAQQRIHLFCRDVAGFEDASLLAFDQESDLVLDLGGDGDGHGRLVDAFSDAFGADVQRRTLFLLFIYGVLFVIVGPWRMLEIVGAAVIVSLVAEDLLLLSQHTHVPQNVSDGDAVRPFPAIEQGQFTRSLRLPAIVSRALLHFDAHELHHMYPFVPGYHLRRIPYQASHEVDWWTWVAGARRMKGEVLLYQSRLETGSEL